MYKVKLTALTLLLISGLLFSFSAKKNKHVIEFLKALDSTQLEKVILPFNDSSRSTWHFLPGKMWERSGIELAELKDNQKELFSKMLMSFLSETGYTKTLQIIELENVLAKIENNPDFRDPENYFIAIYGNPKKDNLWAWSFEGHHISLNFTILDNKITASPRFFGVNPATIKHGPRKGERVLDKEEDIAYELLNTFNTKQKEKAIFQNHAFKDIVTSNASEVTPLAPVGIEIRHLNSNQKSLIKKLIAIYLNSLPQEIALERENKIHQEEFNQIRFGWAGSVNKNEAHYYRIQGNSFLIEFDNIQNKANHIHTVWRDFKGDFGRDLIREHYMHAKHHQHN